MRISPLHVAAYFIEHKSHIGPVATVLSVAVPLGVFLGAIYALYYYLVRKRAFDAMMAAASSDLCARTASPLVHRSALPSLRNKSVQGGSSIS